MLEVYQSTAVWPVLPQPLLHCHQPKHVHKRQQDRKGRKLAANLSTSPSCCLPMTGPVSQQTHCVLCAFLHLTFTSQQHRKMFTSILLRRGHPQCLDFTALPRPSSNPNPAPGLHRPSKVKPGHCIKWRDSCQNKRRTKGENSPAVPYGSCISGTTSRIQAFMLRFQGMCCHPLLTFSPGAGSQPCPLIPDLIHTLTPILAHLPG